MKFIAHSITHHIVLKYFSLVLRNSINWKKGCNFCTFWNPHWYYQYNTLSVASSVRLLKEAAVSHSQQKKFLVKWIFFYSNLIFVVQHPHIGASSGVMWSQWLNILALSSLEPDKYQILRYWIFKCQSLLHLREKFEETMY